MSVNPLNEISKIYLEQISEANDGNLANNYPPYDKVTRGDIISGALGQDQMGGKRKSKKQKVKEELVGNQNKIDVAAPYGKLTSADFKELRKGKKKVAKEGYSNWREDLIEVVDKIESKKDENDKIVEKKVDNKIDINPKLDLGEALENLGGTLLEMVEIDEVDYIIESVYDELLDEGYEEDDIEEALEYALVEAKVTYGHDTPSTAQKKKGNLVAAVGRLARQKLSSKVRGAKRAVSSATVSGLRNVAKGALSAARKLEGDKKPSTAHTKTRTASTYRGAGVGQRERVSSGSYSAPKSEAPKPESKKASAPKVQAKTTTVSSEPLSKEQEDVVKRAQRRNPNLSAQDVTRIASSVPSKKDRQAETRRRMDRAGARIGVSEDYYDLASKTVKSGKPGEEQKRTIETLASKARTKKKTRNPVGTARRGSASFKPSSPEESEANKKSWSDYWSSAAKGYKEQYEILEKAESEQQQKLFGLALSVKRGQTSRDKVSDKVLEIVDSMSEKKIRDFAKTPHKGLPHKIETKEEAVRQEFIARMIEKIEEQSEVYVDEAKLPSSQKKGKKKLESKTQVIHDVDDNLADQRHPDAAKIDVMRKTGGTWKKVQSLTPSQFAHHKLRKPGEPVKEESDPGDKYGFDQFRDTGKFKKTTKANKPVVRLGDSPRRPAKKSVVTARGGSKFGSNKPSTPMDKPGEFAKDLKTRIGVKNLERKNVHFTGGMRSGSGPEKKGEVVKKIVKPDAKKVITTDDHLQNVRHMAAAASSVAPKAKVRAYQSKPATKAKGKVKPGDIVPVRVGKEGDLKDKNIGIRSNTSPSKSPKETQKRRKQQKMREAIETPQPTSQQPKEQKPDQQQKKIAQQKDRQRQQEIQILNRKLQTLRSAPKGTDTDVTV